MKTKIRKTDIRTLRKIATSLGWTWHVQGDGWIFNGTPAHYQYTRNTGERDLLIDKLTDLSAWHRLSESEQAVIQAAS